MNIYKAPNVIISPKRKIYRRWRGAGALNDESIYTLTCSLSLSFPPPPYTETSQCQEKKATGTGKDASLEQI